MKRLLLMLAVAMPVYAAQPAGDGSALQEQRDSLQQQLAAEPYNVDLNYQLGVIAYRQHDYLTALEMFERTVALNPRHAGALLDMAMTYFERGDYTEAESLFTRLDALPDSERPAAVGLVIADYRQRLGEMRREWKPSGMLSVGVGYSNNANQGLSSGLVTLPTDLTLEVNPALRARSDSFADLALEGRLQRNLGDGQLYLLGGVSQRQWQHETAYRQSWLVAGAGYLKPLVPGYSLDSSLLLVDGELGGAPLQQAGFAYFQLTHEPGPFRQWLRLELGQRRFPQSTAYNNHSQRLVLGGGYATSRWALSSEAGYTQDRPDGDRPGGARERTDILLEGRLQLAPRWMLSARWQAEREQQQQPFQPDDFGSFVRADINRTQTLALAWQCNASQRWELVAERQHLTSNLDLYDLSRKEIRLQWQYRWH